MKKKITVKRANQIVDYGVGYCQLQHLFSCKQPFAYTATNTYGWRSDLYDLGSIIISTGYAPQGRKIPYHIVEHFEQGAMNIIQNTPDYESRKNKLDGLIEVFLSEVKEIA